MAKVKCTKEYIESFIKNQGYYFMGFGKNGYNYGGSMVIVWCGNPNHKPYEVRFNAFERGARCKQCYHESRKGKYEMTHEEFIEKVHEKNPNIKINSVYKGSHGNVDAECLVCGYDDWHPRAEKLIQNKPTGCPRCANNIPYTTETFIQRMKKVNKNNIKVNGEYTGAWESIDVECLDCGYKWSPSAHSLIMKNPTGCPRCNQSKGEKEIEALLLQYNIIFEPQKEYSGLVGLKGGNLSYDFYLPDYNLLIEYQGQYHDGTSNQQTEEQFKKQQEHDRRKREYAENNNINLLEIWYWDYDNIENILKRELNL